MTALRAKPTIIDIARESGVSPATVDRVLNERDGVRRATVDKVIAVAQRLNYPLPAQMMARPGLTHLNFDFILPSGPNTFMQTLSRLVTEIEHADSMFSARGRLHSRPSPLPRRGSAGADVHARFAAGAQIPIARLGGPRFSATEFLRRLAFVRGGGKCSPAAS